MNTEEDDRLLWQRAASGHTHAFAVLYERHAQSVRAFCLRQTANCAQADDLTSAVFLKAWEERKKLRPKEASARPLLIGIANNLVQHQWRSTRRYKRAVERHASLASLSVPSHDERSVERIDALRQLERGRNALVGLPKKQAEALAVVAWGDMTYEEAAVALNVPVGTIRSRVARARAELSRSFSVPDRNSFPICPKVKPAERHSS